MKLNRIKSGVRNLAGGHAHDIGDPKAALTSVVVNQLLESTYYETDIDALDKLATRFTEAKNQDPEFPLKLAAWARQEAYVRDVPQVLLAMSAATVDTRPYVRTWAPSIIDRADELCTVLAVNNTIHAGSPGDFSAMTPWTLKQALKDVLESGKFDRYQLAKYRQEGHAVSMRDVLNVSHPTPPNDELDVTFAQIIDGTLTQERTWETVISAGGDWQDVLPDMGLFARIRNVRNMLDAGLSADEIFDDVTDDWIRASKLYPFRFYQAFMAANDPNARGYLEHMLNVSCDNVPKHLRNTLAVVDLSGSMTSPISGNSSLQRREISALFGAIMGSHGAQVVAFADRTAWIAPRDESVLNLQGRIQRKRVGSSTFAHKAIQDATSRGAKYDRVVVFTDMQIWERYRFGNDPNALRGSWEEYVDRHPETPWLYMVDLASYGEIKLPEGYPNVRRIRGWSSNIFDYMDTVETAQVDAIDAYEPRA